MRNILLSAGTADTIDKQVSKIFRGLGNPEPPIDLDAVYKLEKLDPHFYTKNDEGVFRESISRVKVGAQLILENPTRIWDAVKKWDLKALYVPSQRRILIDGSLHNFKIRWNGAHEIGHSILEWHQDYTWGDTLVTLSEACHEQLEAEANYAAGRLLFFQDTFAEHVKGSEITLRHLNHVSKTFGNSWTSTLYRAVECLDTPAFAVIGSHPRRHGADRFKYFVRSIPFTQRFPAFDEVRCPGIFATYCTYSTKGPLGSGSFSVEDLHGERYKFTIESFAIPQGEVLTLAHCTGKDSRAF